jgi:hypothetical protein
VRRRRRTSEGGDHLHLVQRRRPWKARLAHRSPTKQPLYWLKPIINSGERF